MAKVHIKDHPNETLGGGDGHSPNQSSKLRTLKETVQENMASQMSIVNTVEAM